MNWHLIFTTAIVALTSNSITAQIVNIPDANFKAYLLGEPTININTDGEIQVSEATAYTGDIDCSDYNIADFTGIEAFTSVPKVYIDGNLHTSLDVTGMTALWKLESDDSDSLASVTFSNNPNLSWLNFNNCNLSNLDVSVLPALEILHMHSNSITAIDLSNNPNLLLLDAGSNNLTSLDLSNNVWLSDLYTIWNTSLQELDLSNNPSLGYLQLSYCNLVYLNVANGNNTNLSDSDFRCNGNSNLDYICVDDTAYSNNNWFSYVDTHYVFVDTCAIAPGAGLYDTRSDQITFSNNPTRDFVFLSEPRSYTLLTISGSVIMREVQSNMVDMHDLAPGIYILMVLNEDGLRPATYKLVKQ